MYPKHSQPATPPTSASRTVWTLVWSVALLFLLAALALCTGSVSLPLTEVADALSGHASPDSTAHFIVIESRLPQLCNALLTGSALALCGLVMQTLFSNPLADPSLLGVNSGASLGAAVALLACGGTWAMGTTTVGGTLLTIGAAFIGAMGVIGLLLLASTWLRSTLALLVTGVMISFGLSAVISLLSFYATADGVRSYVVWGLGDFSGITLQGIPLYALFILIPALGILSLSRPLNALLLGPDYAANLGIRVQRVRTWLLLLTGLLTATVTAICGPISFIGLAVPHMARLLLRSTNHRRLLPLTALLGADLALLTLILSHLPGERGTIPLAAITPIMGVPMVLYIMLRHRG